MNLFLGLCLLTCSTLLYSSEIPQPLSRKAVLSSSSDQNSIYVKKIAISGNIRVATKVLHNAVLEDERKSLNYKKLEQTLKKINKRYRDLGFKKARAIIKEQKIKNCVLNIYITTNKELAKNPIKIVLTEKKSKKNCTKSKKRSLPKEKSISVEPVKSIANNIEQNSSPIKNSIMVDALSEENINPVEVPKAEIKPLEVEIPIIKSVSEEEIKVKVPLIEENSSIENTKATPYKIEKALTQMDKPKVIVNKADKPNTPLEKSTESSNQGEKEKKSGISREDLFFYFTNTFFLILPLTLLFF